VTRRLLVILTTTALLLSGCARSTTSDAAAPAPSPSAAADRTGDIYLAVLERYLGTPTDNSFGVWNDKPVYVLDQAYPSAGDPMTWAKPGSGTPIPPNVQQRITGAVTGVTFVADRESVLLEPNGCVHVKNDGILITLGTLEAGDTEVHVGISGVAGCTGATWLTYDLHHNAGTGWRVTGTTLRGVA
jgi:hypothetical protein